MEKLLVALLLATAGIGLFTVLITVLLLHVRSSLDALIEYERLKESHWQQDQQVAHDQFERLVSPDSPATRAPPTLRVVPREPRAWDPCENCHHQMVEHTPRNRNACEVPGCPCIIFHAPDSTHEGP